MPETSGDSYSPAIGLVYVFNLIIGTGALTLPLAFSQAGLLCGVITLIVLCFFSYITASWVIEAMAAANAILNNRTAITTSPNSDCVSTNSGNSAHSGNIHVNNVHVLNTQSNITANPIHDVHEDSSSDDRPLLSTNSPARFNFEITKRIELGAMAALFFNRTGTILFYICLIVYLYGDLAIYSAAVPKNMRDMFCYDHDSKHPDDCWERNETMRIYHILPKNMNSRDKIYQVFLSIFIVIIGPFTFFNVQKTKLLQVVTSVFRWLAISLMIGITSARVIEGKGKGNPIIGGNLHGLPMLFGCSIYSFMCHHSLPGMITPVNQKRKFLRYLGYAYLVILMFYSFMCVTAILCFDNSKLQDMYTLNFINDETIESSKFHNVKYLFGLFPVVTLGTSFPIISVTLCNNLRSLFELVSSRSLCNWQLSSSESTRSREMRRGCSVAFRVFLKYGIPLLTVIPPAMIASYSSNLELLVGFTGSYAGAGIQYITPAFLVICSRRHIMDNFGLNWQMRNQYRSPFHKPVYIWLTLCWCVICIVFVTLDKTKLGESLTNGYESYTTKSGLTAIDNLQINNPQQVVVSEFSDNG